MSRFLSFCILIVLSPVFLIVSVIILIDDGFPVFFRQKRVGQNEKYFWIFKFRTMKKNIPDIPTHLLTDSIGIYTKSGPFLRKYSLDEIPQFLNIFLGELAFIGPRPALHNQQDLIKLRRAKDIHKLKPGITGWAQVNGRDSVSIDEKVRLDYFYFLKRSPYLDIKIIFMTILKVLIPKDVKI